MAMHAVVLPLSGEQVLFDPSELVDEDDGSALWLVTPHDDLRLALEQRIEMTIETGGLAAATAAIELLDALDGDADVEAGDHDLERDCREFPIPEYGPNQSEPPVNAINFAGWETAQAWGV